MYHRLIHFPLNLIFFPFYFFPWWYIANLSFWWRFISRGWLLLVNGLGILALLKNLFAPYREDRTVIGYLIGFSARLILSLAFSVFVLVVFLVLVVIFLVYLGLPPLTVYLWFFIQETQIWLALPLTMLLILLYWRFYLSQPKQANSMTLKAAKIWRKAEKQAYSPTLLFELLQDDPKIQLILQRLDFGADLKPLLDQIAKADLPKVGQSISWRNVLFEARTLRGELDYPYLDVDLLFLAQLKADPRCHQALRRLEIDLGDFGESALWVEARRRARESWRFWRDEYFKLWGGPERAFVAGWIPHLKHFTDDITQAVYQGQVPHIVGREKEINQILAFLNRTTQNNVLIVGPTGVGKTSLIYGIAERMIRGDIEGVLKDKKILRLDVAGMLAGTKERGDLEARIQAAIAEIESGRVILFIDEIEQLMENGFEYFLPALESGQIQMIGTTTPKAYRLHIEKNTAIASQFQLIHVDEPPADELVPIIQSVATRIESKQGVMVTLPAIKAAIELTHRYIHDQVLPDKAIDVLDEAAVWVSSRAKKEKKLEEKTAASTAELAFDNVVNEDDVVHIIAKRTGVPLDRITVRESERLMHLEKILHERIIDQNEAVMAVSAAMRRARAGLQTGQRPLASFLFVGPTGVGKTETAKALSDTYFGSEEKLVRLDMSEYSEKYNIARLIGAAPGFPGYEEGGQLTEAVRRQPFAVILLDEIEKAHPDVLNLLLQVLDDGRLTDGSGNTVDFSNTLIICTSNAFSAMIYERLGREEVRQSADVFRQTYQSLKEELFENLQKVFRPELLNRFDGIIIFSPLSMVEVKKITQLLLGQVVKKMQAKDILLQFAPEVVSEVARLGFDPKFGARPLRRVIQEQIEDVLAEKILKGELRAGDEVTFTTAMLKG